MSDCDCHCPFFVNNILNYYLTLSIVYVPSCRFSSWFEVDLKWCLPKTHGLTRVNDILQQE